MAVHKGAATRMSEIVPVNSRGGVTLPKSIRDRIPADSPVVRFSELSPGRFVVEIVAVVPIADAWYHSARWQEMEREAQADIDAGRVRDVPEGGMRELLDT